VSVSTVSIPGEGRSLCRISLVLGMHDQNVQSTVFLQRRNAYIIILFNGSDGPEKREF
jgi:hypothetical protein